MVHTWEIRGKASALRWWESTTGGARKANDKETLAPNTKQTTTGGKPQALKNIGLLDTSAARKMRERGGPMGS